MSRASESVYVVRHAAGEDVVRIVHASADPGWNALGRFPFDGPAEVELRDVGDGLVLADAVRFVKSP